MTDSFVLDIAGTEYRVQLAELSYSEGVKLARELERKARAADRDIARAQRAVDRFTAAAVPDHDALDAAFERLYAAEDTAAVALTELESDSLNMVHSVDGQQDFRDVVPIFVLNRLAEGVKDFLDGSASEVRS